MSSTILVCALRYDRATIAWNGDLRCYLIGNQKARVITIDYIANDHLRLGVLSKKEAKTEVSCSTSRWFWQLRRSNLLLPIKSSQAH
jgi:serine/threonine protein phosphatase PrpC